MIKYDSRKKTRKLRDALNAPVEYCLVRFIESKDSKILSDFEKRLQVTFGAIRWQTKLYRGKYRFIIEIYLDFINRYVEEHFSTRGHRLGKKSKNLIKVKKVVHTLFEELAHLIGYHQCVIIEVEGGIKFD